MAVVELLEADLVCDADVVHETLHRAERPGGLGDELQGGGRLREIADDPERGAALPPRLLDPLRVAAAHGDVRPFVREQLRGREADAPGRAGHDADTVTQAEIQGRLV